MSDLQGWEGRTQGWESHQGAQIPEAVLKEGRAEERPAPSARCVGEERDLLSSVATGAY